MLENDWVFSTGPADEDITCAASRSNYRTRLYRLKLLSDSRASEDLLFFSSNAGARVAFRLGSSGLRHESLPFLAEGGGRWKGGPPTWMTDCPIGFRSS